MTKARNLADNALTTVSPTELGYVDGVTSPIQTQLDAKVAKSTVTAKGDLIAATASSTVSNLAVGTDGQVLTAASGQTTGLQWTTPGLTLISTTTIGSAVSSISLPNNTFTSTYDNYKVLISLARTTATSASGVIVMRYRASGTDNSAAQYNSNGFESRETTLSNIQTVSATSQIVGYNLSGGYEARTSIDIDIFGPNIAKQTTCHIATSSMDGGTRVAFQRNGWHNVEASYDSLTFYPSGTITNGRISVYGYNN